MGYTELYALNDDGENCDYYESEIYLQELQPGTYYIKIYGHNNNYGNFTLLISGFEVNTQIVNYIPKENEINVALNAPVSVIFNQKCQFVGFIKNYNHRNGNNTVSNVSASIENSTLVINHDDFDFDTPYTVIIPNA